MCSSQYTCCTDRNLTWTGSEQPLATSGHAAWQPSQPRHWQCCSDSIHTSEQRRLLEYYNVHAIIGETCVHEFKACALNASSGDCREVCRHAGCASATASPPKHSNASHAPCTHTHTARL